MIQKSKEIFYDEYVENTIKDSKEILKSIMAKQVNDPKVLSKLEYSYYTSKVYLYIILSIKNRVTLFNAQETSTALNIPLRTVYKVYEFFLDLGEISKNKQSSVTHYVVSAPLNEFVTNKRVKTAIETLKKGE